MRWLPLFLVSAVVIAVLVVADPAVLGLCCTSDPSTQAPDAEFIAPCRLLRVVDGDTLEVVCQGGAEERVRLLRVDTPERGEPGHAAARRALRDALGRDALRLLLEEPDQPVRDRYGRLLAYVYAGERNQNVEQVRRGWSRFQELYGGGRFAPAFRAAEQEARHDARGLWAPEPAPES